jgi:S-DNA-T family DNA segregation ATPase FtsK/SpoIIIE
MRREIISILLFFLVIFVLISLLSYSHLDPSIHHAKSSAKIYNLFGMVGAQLAGLLVGLFGLGAFWIPVLLLIVGLHLLGHHPRKMITCTLGGGLLLIITTGSLLALKGGIMTILGSQFSSGGMVGIPLTSLLIKYANLSGAAIILVVLWIVGFILATGFSLIAFLKAFSNQSIRLGQRMKQFHSKWIKRREKSKKQIQIKAAQKTKRAQQIKIKAPKPKPIRTTPIPKQEVFKFMQGDSVLQMPSVNFLIDPEPASSAVDDENLRMQSKLLEKKLEDFGVNGKVVTVTPGPVITTFEYEPAPGVKINKIVNLSDDLALTLRATSIRIVAPIPGKSVIGIEIPNLDRELVRFKELVVSSAFAKSKSCLTLCLGKDIVGHSVVAELDRMPHLLIAGATGTGKSVALNTMICSLLYKSTPEDFRLILVDPKRIELSIYDGIPHLITPVVTESKKATNALFWAVREMEHRYELLASLKARNIGQYNKKVSQIKKSADDDLKETLPYIVIIIDELADLMMVASRDVEVALTRLAQMARAAGIHLILATQRPSVDVLTGIIKANFPTRLTFQVSSKTDSRTIIDTSGAENLLGNGDMLFMPPGTAKLQRIHGAYIDESELMQVIEFLKEQKTPDYDTTILEPAANEKSAIDKQDYDEKYDEAVALVTKTRQASISMIQRHMRIGYNRAARIIEVMEKEGIVGPSDGVKAREVLVRDYDDSMP